MSYIVQGLCHWRKEASSAGLGPDFAILEDLLSSQSYRAERAHHAHALEGGPAAFGLEVGGFDRQALGNVYFYKRFRLRMDAEDAGGGGMHHLYQAVKCEPAFVDGGEHEGQGSFETGHAEGGII